ncbi:hypothetical protein E4U31_001049 [Claviceps sp. LM219 group G6]|nr:hypothetical protein E4U31_001049 [Claviceps sp. LM219 group G6]
MNAPASTPERVEAAAPSPQPATDLDPKIAVPSLHQDGETEDATATAPEEDEAHTDGDDASSTSRSNSVEKEEGEIDGRDGDNLASAPPLPAEPLTDASSGPPLPEEPIPQADDGWDCLWDPNTQAWFFYNRFTGNTQWENPRAPHIPSTADSAAAPSNDGSVPLAPVHAAAPASTAPAIASSSSDDLVGGYNPAIHGDYDPNAWYAQKYIQPDETAIPPEIPSLEDEPFVATAGFNRFTGHFQQPDAGPSRHADEAKSKRQMNAFFDVDAAANADDGRSLKAERSNKRISKAELKAFKEKRKARKEEKRRAWLRD